MSRYRSALPQMGSDLFLTDGGIETDLIFNRGCELPEFAAFHLLHSERGREELEDYHRTYAQIAADHRVGFILESATWRANVDWGRRIGYDDGSLRRMNLQAIDMLAGIREDLETPSTPMVISGCIGPRGDGYAPSSRMSTDEAARYHAFQVAAFAESEADMVTAITMNYAEEAMGIVLAARDAGMASVISFTVETDGRLPSEQPLGDAIQAVDDATGGGPTYYMINCAHPTHFADALLAGEDWTERVRGIRANASKKSHAELDESLELDTGAPVALAGDYRRLTTELTHLNVLGGCCGTDHRHIAEIARACAAA